MPVPGGSSNRGRRRLSRLSRLSRRIRRPSPHSQPVAAPRSANVGC